MQPINAATLYIGLFVLLFIILKLNAGRVRAGAKVSIGDGDDEQMKRAMRVQGNAVEDVPITLLGVLALAHLSAPVMLIHLLGGGFFVFRVLHALGLGGAPGFAIGRAIGTIGTLLVLIATTIGCLYYALA